MKRSPLYGTAWVLLPVLVFSCVYPTDQSGALKVEIVEGISQLFVGDSMRVRARVVDSRGTVVGNVTVAFASSDDDVLVIDATGRVFGVSEGLAQVQAKAVQLDDAASATLPVRVFRGIEIFDVVADRTPPDGGAVAHYGETISVIGVGLDPAELALLQVGVEQPHVVGFVPAVVTDPDSRDTLRLIVPAPIQSDVDVVALGTSGATAVWPLKVIRSDYLEPNDNPPPIDLGTVTAPINLTDFALERAEDGDPDGYLFPRPFDLYRVHFDPAAPAMSIVFSTPRAGATPNELDIRLFITESIEDIRTEGLHYDALTPAHTAFGSAALCQGNVVQLYHSDPGPDGPNRRGRRDSMIVALNDIPPDGFQIGALDITLSTATPPTEPIPYDIRIVPGYLSDLPPDQGEENDFCGMAFPLPMDGVPLDFNFDHASDVDWYRFTVGGDSLRTAPTTTDVTEMEPNDTPETADTVALGDRVSGAISPGGDVDGFRFFATAGTILDFDVTAYDAGSDLDPVLQLFDSVGTEVAFNDDYGPTLDSRLIYRVPTSGWYDVAILDFGLWCCGDPRVGGPKAPNGFYEIALSQFASGSIASITLTAAREFAGVMEIFEPPETGFREVASWCCSFDNGTNWVEEWSELIQPGEYYIVLHEPAGFSFPYRLTGEVFTIGAGTGPPPEINVLSAPVPPAQRAALRASKETRRLRLAPGARRGGVRP